MTGYPRRLQYHVGMQEMRAPETVRAAVAPTQDSRPGVLVLADPTQVRRPWRSTVRTFVQALVAFAVLWPALVQLSGIQAEDFPWVVPISAVAAAVARIMADPRVEAFLRRFAPFLSAAPKEK